MSDPIYKRFVFLDVDGVLNHDEWYERIRCNHSSKELQTWDHNKRNLDPKAVKLLNQLKGAEVVISSSWGYSEDTVNGLKQAGLKLPIIGGTIHYSICKKWLCRGNDIARWFVDNKYGEPLDIFFDRDGWYNTHVTFNGTVGEIVNDTAEMYTHPDSVKLSYVILDDFDDMLMQQKEHFLHISKVHGLDQYDIVQAKRILNLD